VPVEQVARHLRPDPALAVGGGQRRRLGDRPVDGAVGVEVVGQDQPRPGPGGGVGDAGGHRREEVPAGVHGLGGVVHDGSTGQRPAQAAGVGDVGGDHFDAWLRRGGATADRPHRAAGGGQVRDEGAAGSTGSAEDDGGAHGIS
jgi:hypothetical protein